MLPDDGTAKILTWCLIGAVILAVAMMGLLCSKLERAEAQTLKALEELGELISAVARQECAFRAALRDETAEEALTPELLRGIYEELADARIMLRQLEMIYACRAEVERWERAKLARLAERLGLTEGEA